VFVVSSKMKLEVARPPDESVTDKLDGLTFAGGVGPITLTAAQVNSGLTLNSSYTGIGRPVNNLNLTLQNGTTGEIISGTGRTITVTDPAPLALLAQYMASADAGSGSADLGPAPPSSQTGTLNLASPGH
jgi:hypothetical protein